MSAEPERLETAEGATQADTPSAEVRVTEDKAPKGRKPRGRAKGSEEKEAPTLLEVGAAAYQVSLPAFEGPLDLLLHLIQEHELDISDIPIGFISQKYVEYLMLMQELNIDVASEYLVMAATLAHIKSKMLLPVVPSDQEDEAVEELDPRAELVRRLLEYQKYRHAAEALGDSPVLGRDVFVRGAPAPSVDGPAPLAPISVFKLFDAFQKILARVKQTAEHHIDVDRISISERILQLTDLIKGKGLVPFENLFSEELSRPDLVVTFLAILEMTRLRMMNVVQDGPLAPIQVELTLTDEHEEILSQNFDGGDPLANLSRNDVQHTAAGSTETSENDEVSGEELSSVEDVAPSLGDEENELTEASDSEDDLSV